MKLLDLARALWAREPARIATLGAAAIVFVLARLGVVVSEQSVIDAILLVVPILLAGETVRAHVAPIKGLAADAAAPSDEVNRP